MKTEESKVLHFGTLWGRHLAYSPLAVTMAGVVATLSLLPSLVDLLGFDLRLAEPLPDLLRAGGAGSLRAFSHAILAWISVFVAALVALFAWGRWRITANPEARLLALSLPGTALLNALDAWVTWTPGGGPADAQTLLSTLPRLYLALALLAGGSLLLVERPAASPRRRRGAVSAVAAGLGVAMLTTAGAALAGRLSAPALPWDPLLPRPWELVALLFLTLAGLLVLPQLHREHPSILSYAMILATIPLALAQLEMAFGSQWAGDGHFIAAQLQTLLAYSTLLGGITLDYLEAQHGRRSAENGFVTAQRNLHERTQELERIDRERVVEESKRRLAERSLRMLEKAVETMSLGVTIADFDGKLLYVNPAEAQAHGYTPAELVGQDARIFSANPEVSTPPTGAVTSWTRERIDVTRDGREFPVRLVSDLVLDEEGRPIARVTIGEDITERKLLDRMKHDFISNVSHELRTPLTSIIASLRLLESGRLEGDPGRRGELIAVAGRNGQRLLQLINDLLDLQKLTSGKMSLEIHRIDARALLEEALESIRAFAESCDVELVLELGQDFNPPAGPRLLADRDRLMQILHNLLSNAIKFSPAGETVTLAGTRSENRIVLAVKDRGPGIPEDFQKRLFEPFSQADASPTRRTDGSGLGLSIVKSLVERMAGTVYFDSHKGRGSTFFVELPLDPESNP